jgi:hypothetical protein
MIETEQNETTVWRCRWFSGGWDLVLDSCLQLGWSGFSFVFWFSFSWLMDRSQESLLYWRVDIAVWPELLSCTGVRGTRVFPRTSFASSIWSVMVSSTASQIDWPLLIQIRRSVWLIWSGSTKALCLTLSFTQLGLRKKRTLAQHTRFIQSRASMNPEFLE